MILRALLILGWCWWLSGDSHSGQATIGLAILTAALGFTLKRSLEDTIRGTKRQNRRVQDGPANEHLPLALGIEAQR